MASRLLPIFGGLEDLSLACFQELASIHGMGEAKIAQIKAALEPRRRLLATTGEDRVTIHSPRHVANLLAAEMGLLDQEHFRVLLLNTKNQVLRIREVHKGDVGSAVIRASEVFQETVCSNCPAVILVHDHPSGDPTPSPEDVQTTCQLVKAGKLLDIEVLDHVIVGRTASGWFVSLKEARWGLGKPPGQQCGPTSCGCCHPSRTASVSRGSEKRVASQSASPLRPLI